MKTKINESEIKYILELHSREKNSKNVILEQSQDLESKLQNFIDSGCITGGTIVSMTLSNPNYKKAIKKQSVKNPENTVYFFVDYTAGIKDKSGNFKKIEGKWNCDDIQKASKEASTQAATTDSTSNLAQMKSRNWMEYSELTTNGFSTLEAKEGKYETTKFDMGNGNKITLYRPKNLSGNKEQFTQIQKDFLKKYYDAGYKLKSELTLDEIGSFEQLPINFPDGSGSVVLYKDKENVASDNRYKKCRKTIEDFAQMAKDGLGTKSEIDIAKSYVRRCLEQAGTSGKYLDLGATKKNLEFLRGDIKDEKGKQIKPGSPYFVR
jgi:hypothetical protein